VRVCLPTYSDTNSVGKEAITALTLFAQLNDYLREYGAKQLESNFAKGPIEARDNSGVAYNLTLINYFDPTIRDTPLRDEPYFGSCCITC
jgi:hypothetical protein